MQFPKRLLEIGNFINDGSYVADIGADHGLLELILSASKPNTKVFAVENKRGPYQILFKNVSALKNVTTSLSDGISRVPREVDTLVIAGIGGINAVNILAAHRKKLNHIDTIILDAHRNIPLARRKIVSFGYQIKTEKLVQYQGIYYNIILFEKSNNIPEYSEDELEYGYNIKSDPCFVNYINHLIRLRKKIIESTTNKETIKKLESEIERIKNYGKNEII